MMREVDQMENTNTTIKKNNTKEILNLVSKKEKEFTNLQMGMNIEENLEKI